MLRRVFFVYKLFDAKVDACCSMEPYGILHVPCLEFIWLLVGFKEVKWAQTEDDIVLTQKSGLACISN